MRPVIARYPEQEKTRGGGGTVEEEDYISLSEQDGEFDGHLLVGETAEDSCPGSAVIWDSPSQSRPKRALPPDFCQAFYTRCAVKMHIGSNHCR